MEPLVTKYNVCLSEVGGVQNIEKTENIGLTFDSSVGHQLDSLVLMWLGQLQESRTTLLIPVGIKKNIKKTKQINYHVHKKMGFKNHN